MSVTIKCDNIGCHRDVDDLICGKCLQEKLDESFKEGKAEGYDEGLRDAKNQ